MKCMHFVRYIKQRHILKLHGVTNSTASLMTLRHVTNGTASTNDTALGKGTVTERHHISNSRCIPIGRHVTKRCYPTVPRHKKVLSPKRTTLLTAGISALAVTAPNSVMKGRCITKEHQVMKGSHVTEGHHH